MTRTIIKIAVPVLILILAIGVFQWQMSNRPEPKQKQSKRIIPIVRVTPAELVEGYRYQVSGYGVVEPAGTVTIVSEVAGKIIWVNDKLKVGGKFKKNEWLYRIDDTDYVAAVNSAVANLKSAELELQKIEEEADISKKEWEIWNDTSSDVRKASPLVSYKPQLESAKAAVKSAQSAVVSAKSNLAKVVYKAPFDCIVTEETIELGKIIRAGESAGTLVRTDWYEVYVPVAAKDAVKLKFSENRDIASDGYIELAEGKNAWKWAVYAERILPAADEKTGMLQAVLVVPDPVGTENAERPILPIGASIRAVVNDKEKNSVIRIPDEALREGNVVWVLSDDSKVQIRDVKIMEKRGDFVYVASGLIEGDKVITSSLEGVLDGMPVNSGQKKEPKKGKTGGAQ